jgi:hypothetical protein
MYRHEPQCLLSIKTWTPSRIDRCHNSNRDIQKFAHRTSHDLIFSSSHGPLHLSRRHRHSSTGVLHDCPLHQYLCYVQAWVRKEFRMAVCRNSLASSHDRINRPGGHHLECNKHCIHHRHHLLSLRSFSLADGFIGTCVARVSLPKSVSCSG